MTALLGNGIVGETRRCSRCPEVPLPDWAASVRIGGTGHARVAAVRRLRRPAARRDPRVPRCRQRAREPAAAAALPARHALRRRHGRRRRTHVRPAAARPTRATCAPPARSAVATVAACARWPVSRVPVLETAFERSLGLAASMESRGYGRAVRSTTTSRRAATGVGARRSRRRARRPLRPARRLGGRRARAAAPRARRPARRLRVLSSAPRATRRSGHRRDRWTLDRDHDGRRGAVAGRGPRRGGLGCGWEGIVPSQRAELPAVPLLASSPPSSPRCPPGVSPHTPSELGASRDHLRPRVGAVLPAPPLPASTTSRSRSPRASSCSSSVPPAAASRRCCAPSTGSCRTSAAAR